ncbi:MULTISPECIES: LamG-like jellyroll fold domain-containing protein [Aestuariibaculum]|uniref:LamG-like jellyroll fold domain-containing protein n=1 Tax=Aestuariibaculum TaxID=1386924 RepID=UPI002159FA21|nr:MULTISPECIES: LamG-like jellyroll fold domain-containing protein [Aestuariibaculum]MCR8667406.1 helix-turn-helix domain-containing protein [Aestuariibaculum sp. M13]
MKNEQFGVEDLSKESGYSRSQLYRKIKLINGKSISKFVRDIRLEEALKLIVKSALSISEIAYEVGFSSPNYFSRCFHEKYNYTPLEVRYMADNEGKNKILQKFIAPKRGQIRKKKVYYLPITKRHYIVWIIFSLIVVFVFTALVKDNSKNQLHKPVLKHAYTFENGVANDVVGDADGIIRGDGEIVNGLFITDEQGEYLELPGKKIRINEYSAITLEAYVIAGKGNGTWTMVSYFGDRQNEIGVNYIYQTLVNNGNSGSTISCLNYKDPWATGSNIYSPSIEDDEFHHIVTTYDNNEMKYYLDGSVVSIRPSLNSDNLIKNLSNKLAYLGKSGFSQDQTWFGAIDTFNIYEGILDEETIRNSAKKYVNRILQDNSVHVPKPVLKHSYTFEDGTTNDVIGNANGIIKGDVEIIDGLFVTNSSGEYLELPGEELKINEYASITLETFILAGKNNNALYTTLAYFGNVRGNNGVDYIGMTAKHNQRSGVVLSCKNYSSRPWLTTIGILSDELIDGKYHHMVITFDNNFLKFYIDGVLEDARINLRKKSNIIANISDKLAYLCYSGYSNPGDQTWFGAIDTFNIYEGVLDAETIANTAKQYLKDSKRKEQLK